jgi:dephospho-CoA kinase
MKIIGAVGFNAAGKDELVDYLHQWCGLPVLSMGDIVRQMAEEEGVKPTRENLHQISQQALADHGADHFARRLVDRIRSEDWEREGL